MESLKNCTTCKHHTGYSIDDVSNECYPCVWGERTLGYYPGWEPREGSLTAGENLRRKIDLSIEKDKMKKDNVNSPDHYTQGGIETINYIRAKLGDEGTIAYCMGNVMKYTSRWQDKNGLEDLKKADWYLDYAINMLENK